MLFFSETALASSGDRWSVRAFFKKIMETTRLARSALLFRLDALNDDLNVSPSSPVVDERMIVLPVLPVPRGERRGGVPPGEEGDGDEEKDRDREEGPVVLGSDEVVCNRMPGKLPSETSSSDAVPSWNLTPGKLGVVSRFDEESEHEGGDEPCLGLRETERRLRKPLLPFLRSFRWLS